MPNEWSDTDLTPDKIWNIAQNRPILIARDLEKHGVPQEITMKTLLARGVFKWFGVRRSLIKLKDTLRVKISSLNYDIGRRWHRDGKSMDYMKGYLHGLEEARNEIRKLCHSERWQAPDNDRHAERFLRDFQLKDSGEL